MKILDEKKLENICDVVAFFNEFNQLLNTYLCKIEQVAFGKEDNIIWNAIFDESTDVLTEQVVLSKLLLEKTGEQIKVLEKIVQEVVCEEK